MGISESSLLMRLVRQQAIYLSVAAIIAAVFWAIGQPVNPATVILYALCLGNLLTTPMHYIRSRFSRQPSPLKWLIFLATLIVVGPVAYVLSSVLVAWLAPPTPQSAGHLIRTGWKFPSLAVAVYGVMSFLYVETRERLERRNLELQHSIELTSAQLEIQEQELERAREIQESLLPKEIPQIPGFEVATSWLPARVVGGDYFDALRLGEHRLAICIADVAGKGVSAALLMASVQATVRAFARETEAPAHVCSRVNSVLCGNIDAGKFVSFFYGILDADRRTLEYCNAGHPGPLLVSGNTTRQLPTNGAVLGVFPAWKYVNEKVTIASGDKLLLFTDGITEVCGRNGEEFGEAQLATIVKRNSESACALNRILVAQVTEFCASHFQDDATLMVVAAQ